MLQRITKMRENGLKQGRSTDMIEAIVILAVIIVLCIILGVSMDMMIIGAVGIVFLMILSMTLFFVYSTVRLVMSKKCSAKFLRIDKRESDVFSAAVYEIDGNEYFNAFPSEKLRRIYKNNAQYEVLLNRHTKKVYDKLSVLTVVLGTISSLLLTAASVIFVFYMFKM